MTRLRINGVEEEFAVATIDELLAARGIDPRPGFSPSRSTVRSCAVPNGRRDALARRQRRDRPPVSGRLSWSAEEFQQDMPDDRSADHRRHHVSLAADCRHRPLPEPAGDARLPGGERRGDRSPSRSAGSASKAMPGAWSICSAAATGCLPNTAGCVTARDAILTAELAREALETNWVKLELIGDRETALPRCRAAGARRRRAGAQGLYRLPYCNDDPVTCQKLADVGCAAVMPLGSLIGSGMGIANPDGDRTDLLAQPGAGGARRRHRHRLRCRLGDGARLRRGDGRHRHRPSRTTRAGWRRRCAPRSRPAASHGSPAASRSAASPNRRARNSASSAPDRPQTLLICHSGALPEAASPEPMTTGLAETARHLVHHRQRSVLGFRDSRWRSRVPETSGRYINGRRPRDLRRPAVRRQSDPASRRSSPIS